MKIAKFVVKAVVLIALSSPFYTHSSQNIIKVGKDQEYKLPSEAAEVAKDGDIIEIDAGVYACDGGVKWRASNLIIRGVNGTAHVTWQNCTSNIPGGKGLWNTLGKNTRIENMEFSYATVSDSNGAGIRHDGGGTFIVKNSFFHHNQNGILVTSNGTLYPVDNNHVHISDSEFSFNGHSSGRSHNMYITNTNTFSIVNSYSHNVDTGHLIKSIARENYIIGNKLEDGLLGTSSYHIDVTGGGPAHIHGNLFIQTQNSPNYVMLAYAAESKEGSRNNPNKRLFVSHNTVINYHDKGKFLKIYDNMNDFETGYVINNLVYGLAESNFVTFSKTSTQNLVSVLNNYLTDGTDFDNLEGESFYLSSSSAAIDSAIKIEGFDLSDFKLPSIEFNRSGSTKVRFIDTKPDIGAFEYDGDIHLLPEIVLNLSNQTIDYLGEVELSWTSLHSHACDISNGLERRVEPNGSILINNLSRDTEFTLTCYGDAGKAKKSVFLNVKESPKAALLPNMIHQVIPDTSLSPYLNSQDPFLSGVMKHWPKGTISSVHVAEQNKVFLSGGGMRTYFGNEIFAFNTVTLTIEQLHQATDIKQLDIFDESDSSFWDVFNYPCSGVWTLSSGDKVAASRNLKQSLTYDYTNNSLFVQGGFVGCSGNYETSDGWLFNTEIQEWQLLHQQRDEFVGTTTRNIIGDRASGLQIIAHNQGVYRFDTSTGESHKLAAALHTSGISSVIDESTQTIFYIGNGKVTSADISNLATLENLEFKSDWKILGDDSLLWMNTPAITYNSSLGQVIGWNKNDRMYYLYIDHLTSTIEIVAKNTPEVESSSIEYIENLGGYLLLNDSRTNLQLLIEQD